MILRNIFMKKNAPVKAGLWCFCFLGLLFVLACGDKKSGSAPGAKKEERQPSPVIIENLGSEKFPVTEQTREIYQWYCTQCHGFEGKGDGINAPHLAVPPRDHTKADYLENRTDRQLFEAIQLGGLAVGRAPCMPAWRHTLDEKTIHSLVRFIRELCQCEAS